MVAPPGEWWCLDITTSDCIAMQRRKYTGKSGPLVPVFFTWRCWAYWLPLVGAFLAVGVAYFFLKRRALARLPCPGCGAV